MPKTAARLRPTTNRAQDAARTMASAGWTAHPPRTAGPACAGPSGPSRCSCLRTAAVAVTEHWVLVTASREWRDRECMQASFLGVQRRFGAPAIAMGIVHGQARGGDRMADDVARDLG